MYTDLTFDFWCCKEGDLTQQTDKQKDVLPLVFGYSVVVVVVVAVAVVVVLSYTLKSGKHFRDLFSRMLQETF